MKILGSDYDGTLSYGGIGKEKLCAIKKWREAGNKFGIISGRTVDYRKYLIKKYPELDLDFFAACNGAYIVDGKCNLIHESRCLTVSALELVMDLIVWGCGFVIVSIGSKKICIAGGLEDVPDWCKDDTVFLLTDFPNIEYFHQVTICLADGFDVSYFAEKIQAKYGDKLTPLKNTRCIDIVSGEINKAQGMYKVMEYFGGSHYDVIVVGDNINDIDMLREFRSYAMQSGVKDIQDVADGIVSDVIEIINKEL